MKNTPYALPSGLDQETRKNTGAFYTPDPIVDLMVSDLLKDRKLPLKICDFACGGGAFLAGVLRYVKKNAPELYKECAQHLTGIDINPQALELARNALPEIPAENFICADTLELELPPEKCFDIIIGNPPYLCGGVRNNAAFPVARQKQLKERFPRSFEYKMNLYALFVEQSTRMAQEFSLLLPDTILCGRYFSRLRRYLAEEFIIREIWLLENPGFDAAPGNAVILHARKGVSPEFSALRCACLPRGNFSDPSPGAHTTDQRRFLRESRCRFQLAFSALEEQIAEKMLSVPDRVRDHFNFASGIISRRGKASIVCSSSGPGRVPALVYGREIHPFEIRREGYFLKLDPENIKSGLSHARFTNPKIFVRQTGYDLVAAVSREKLYALNNCHTGTPAGDFPLETLAALLNSSPMKFLYRFLSGERRRNFAQIDIDLLNELPLLRTPAFDRLALRCPRSISARRELDRKSAALFGLSPEETALIMEEES